MYLGVKSVVVQASAQICHVVVIVHVRFAPQNFDKLAKIRTELLLEFDYHIMIIPLCGHLSSMLRFRLNKSRPINRMLSLRISSQIRGYPGPKSFYMLREK